MLLINRNPEGTFGSNFEGNPSSFSKLAVFTGFVVDGMVPFAKLSRLELNKKTWMYGFVIINSSVILAMADDPSNNWIDDWSFTSPLLALRLNERFEKLHCHFVFLVLANQCLACSATSALIQMFKRETYQEKDFVVNVINCSVILAMAAANQDDWQLMEEVARVKWKVASRAGKNLKWWRQFDKLPKC